MKPTPPEIRAAKKFLERRGVKDGAVSPRMFASACKELDQGFRQTYERLKEDVSKKHQED